MRVILTLTLSTLLSFTLLSAAPALADCQPGVVGSNFLNSFRLKKITGYIPKLGGINGSAHESASGVDPSALSYEKYMNGGSEIVMIAIPQLPHAPGKRSKYFKSIVRVPAIEKQVGKCIMFFAGDHYGKSSNWAGEFGKMDMVHEPPYINATKFNTIRDSELYIMSGPQVVKNKKLILRLPGADAAPSPSQA